MDITYRKTCKCCQAPFLAKHPRTTACGEACKVELRKQAKARKAAQDKARYEADPEAAKAKVAKWKKENPERVREANRRQYHDPVMGQKYKERLSRYTEANKEKCGQRWKENTQRRIQTGEHQALCIKRREILKENTPDLTKEEALKIAQFYRVASLLGKRYGQPFEVDHVIPVSRGGAHHPDNLQILTQTANRKKGAKLPADV